MRALVILLISVIIIANPIGTPSYADQHNQQKWLELNQTADRVLQLVKEEKYSDAKQLLNYFSEQFLKIRDEDQEITMSQLRVVTTSYEKAMGAVTSVSDSPTDRINAVMQFRLVVDALVSEHHPLWKNTEKSVIASFSELKAAAEKGDGQAFQHRLNEFLSKYQMIRPAIMINLEPQYFERVESQIRFLENYRTQIIGDPNKVKHLDMIEKDLHSLYKGFEQDSADPSLWWVIISVGGMIVVSLTYVGWKKYQAEKNKVKVKQ
ncbi:sporulation protein YpjB [Anaerobacillus sp. MEB173]|uniref:sporulation protein YpjB n=1 Tax=Anaerobacillus sp. MEB173 TaxID=3383345 RepID=UPI003F9325DC